MKRTSALRRNASYMLGVIALASGVVAGAALADGLPAGLTTSVLPTVGVSTAVSTPVVTATVTTPTVSTPTVSTPTVSTPTVSTPTVSTPTVSTPTVTAKATTTVALPPVTTVVAKAAATVSTPTVPAKTVSTPTVPAKTVSVPPAQAPQVTVAVSKPPPAAASAPVQAKVDVTAGQAHAGTTVGAAGTSSRVSAPAGVSAQVSAPSTAAGPALPAAPAAQASVASLSPLLGASGGLIFSGPPSSAGPVRSLRTAFAPVRSQGDTGQRLATGAGSVLVSPLVRQLGTGTTSAALAASSVPELRPADAGPTSTWSGVSRHPAAVAGGLAVLTALAVLGIAAAARSSAGVAACVDLMRFPFPRFRVLPCPGVGSAARGLEAGAVHSTAGVAGSAEAPPRPEAVAPSEPPAVGPSPGQEVVPRLGGVLGTAVSTSQPWEILKAVVLAMLAAANALLVAARWRLGRLQGR